MKNAGVKLIDVFNLHRLAMSDDVMRFSTASTTPSFVRMAIAVEPSCAQEKNTRERGFVVHYFG